MNMRGWIVLLIVVVLVVGGYVTYEYLKNKPPSWLISLVTKTDPPPPLPEGDLAPLQAPEGFAARIFSRDVPGARVMTRDQKGTLLASLTKDGKVVALPDLDANGVADRTVTVVENLKQPHGILVLCDSAEGTDPCVLYVAETGELRTYSYDAETYTASYIETLTTYPTGDGHFTRTLLPHPDGERLLMSVGSSCNVCDEKDPRRATVLALNLTTNVVNTFATGLRNTVFMAIDPVTGEVWGTDNGRDLIGDDIPPDEINIIQEGGNYGWPICYGKKIHDTDFDTKQYIRDPCEDSTASHIDLQAHSAALGIAFIPEEGWPDGWGNDVLVAYHGSWNRSIPTGYKVVHIDLTDAREMVGTPRDFLTGFLPKDSGETDNALGRPVGLLAEPGGTLYVSDDRAGAIYRIERTDME